MGRRVRRHQLLLGRERHPSVPTPRGLDRAAGPGARSCAHHRSLVRRLSEGSLRGAGGGAVHLLGRTLPRRPMALLGVAASILMTLYGGVPVTVHQGCSSRVNRSKVRWSND